MVEDYIKFVTGPLLGFGDRHALVLTEGDKKYYVIIKDRHLYRAYTIDDKLIKLQSTLFTNKKSLYERINYWVKLLIKTEDDSSKLQEDNTELLG